MFGIMASFVGPYVGYYIYQFSGQSFVKSSFYVSGIYVLALIAFYILFYLDYTPGEVENKIALKKKLEQEEENVELMETEGK